MEENNIDNDLAQEEARRSALLQEEQRKERVQVSAKNSEDNKAKISQETKEGANSFRTITDKLLQGAYKNIFITWTLSMFYAYAHAFLNLILPKYFGPLGHEWTPAEIKKSSPELAEKMGKKVSIVEKFGCFSCCLFHLTLIIGAVAIVYFMANKWSLLVQAVGDWLADIFKTD